jgi:hypothetical protein
MTLNTAAYWRQQSHLIPILQHIRTPRILLIHRHSHRIPNSRSIQSTPPASRNQIRNRSTLYQLHILTTPAEDILQHSKIKNSHPHIPSEYASTSL